MLEYATDRGIIDMYKSLLYNPLNDTHPDSLGDNEWFLFNATGIDGVIMKPSSFDSQASTTTSSDSSLLETWFAQRYESRAWKFNIHYIAAYNEVARLSILQEYKKAGFYDTVLASIGNTFNQGNNAPLLQNLTCFHTSFMGISEADNSFTHTDIYATNNKGFNIIYPIITVNNSSPELDIIGDNTNIVVSIKYLNDIAYVIGDYGYHKTSPIIDNYYTKNEMRIVVGTYCGQIDYDTHTMMKYIYDGEPPAPFLDQFNIEDVGTTRQEIHWSRDDDDKRQKKDI